MFLHGRAYKLYTIVQRVIRKQVASYKTKSDRILSRPESKVDSVVEQNAKAEPLALKYSYEVPPT